MMKSRVVTTLALASMSPRRLELLASLGVIVDVVSSSYNEMDMPELTPIELARTHARGKLAGVHGQAADSLVIAADTVVDLDGTSLGKPQNPDDANRMLQALSGRRHVVHTAFAVRLGNDVIERTGSTEVHFSPLSQQEIAEYVATGDSMDKAGAYGIQGRGAALVERIDGDFYTVMGFPLGLFVRTLRDYGVILGGTR
ncbi:MAG: Maf family protein [Vulcanimicrobiaceae bacterium]